MRTRAKPYLQIRCKHKELGANRWQVKLMKADGEVFCHVAAAHTFAGALHRTHQFMKRNGIS
ncbi:hypothetical protein [Rhodococcus sp. 11-3]|uniref:hypothetical protein n=1 Tax=Rhodococcus sp. 11-3 TaxID=2854796 RepID=UPI002041D337|nr:hypothetical protein [Rhodococcus sp. 11-3]USC16980.1 hypothetical protein KZJ41_08995 [Rhodococcus sp. 11-3]